MLPVKLPIVLVHGGLYEGMTSTEFWRETGVLGALGSKHLTHLAPQRPERPRSWGEEVATLLAAIDEAGYDKVALVGASNGCSTATRLALDYPDRVSRLMLAWPATAGEQVVDDLLRVIISDEASPLAADALLSGETLRGVSNVELGSLDLPVVVYPSLMENQIHQRSTLMGLLSTINNAFMVQGSPEPPDADFPEFLDAFVTMVEEFGRVEHDD